MISCAPRSVGHGVRLPNDILSNYVHIGRPERSAFLPRWERVSCLGQIIDERIQPDIDRLRVVAGDRNAPVQAFDWP